MSELCSRVMENEELNEFVHIKHNNSDPAAFYYDQKIDYCADTSVKIREMTIIC